MSVLALGALVAGRHQGSFIEVRFMLNIIPRWRDRQKRSENAVEPKPRVKPPDAAPKSMPPPEPPDPYINIGELFAAYLPHGGDHEMIFPGA